MLLGLPLLTRVQHFDDPVSTEEAQLSERDNSIGGRQLREYTEVYSPAPELSDDLDVYSSPAGSGVRTPACLASPGVESEDDPVCTTAQQPLDVYV